MSTANDPYAPDPHASQNVAAQHRARQNSMPTTNLSQPSAPVPSQHYTIIGIGMIGVFVVVAAIALVTSTLPLPTSQSDTPIATRTPRPTATAVANPAQESATNLIPAYWAPNGEQLPEGVAVEGATVADRQPGWVRLTLKGGGQVWVHQSDVAASFPAPAPPAASAPELPAAPPPPQPTQCAIAGTAANVVTVCGYGDLEAQANAAWAEKYAQPIPSATFPAFYDKPTPNIALQDSLIDDSNPDGLACNGSPMCGGLTNRQAREIVNQQRAAMTATPSP